jgi:2-polyprenyl-3-methyl-5-hydroxy-6-metoxy-1,4-benzoquinol methylase
MESKNGNYKKYTSKNPLMRRVIDGFLCDVESMVGSIDAKTVLDAGCGEGFVLSRLSEKRLVGVDISLGALSVARQNSPGASLACCNIYQMPFKSQNFDLVMAMEVLEHLREPEKAIAEISRLSKRYCLFSVPNEPYFRTMDLLRGKNIARLGNDSEHINHWGMKSFTEIISTNFNIISVRKPFPWIVVLCEKSKENKNS